MQLQGEVVLIKLDNRSSSSWSSLVWPSSRFETRAYIAAVVVEMEVAWATRETRRVLQSARPPRG